MKVVLKTIAQQVVLSLVLVCAGLGQSGYVTKMVADLARPYIYAIQESSDSTGTYDTLLIVSVVSEEVVKSIPVGSGVTDMTIQYGENRLYVTNWGGPSTQVVDLVTQSLLPPLSLGTDVYKINAGRTGRLYYEGEDQWVNIRIINTPTGTEIGGVMVREGDGEVDPTGQYYYHCDNNISNSHITKYDISTDSPVQLGTSSEHPYGSRNLILSGDGSRLFWRGFAYDANLAELRYLRDEIFATTLHGDLAFGSGNVYNAHMGGVVHTFPFNTSVFAVSGDQAKLFAFDSVSQVMVVTPMSVISPAPSGGINPTPANGSTILLPLEKLSWSTDPLVMRYRVFFGTDSGRVAAADTTAPEYLGTTTTSEIALSGLLNLKMTYFWRVDLIGFADTVAGPIWSFKSAPILISPRQLYQRTIAGGTEQQMTLALTAGGEVVSWSATTTVPWLALARGSGQTPDTLAVTFRVPGYAAGVYRDSIRIAAGSSVLAVPVTMELAAMELSQMVADFERPYIYALHLGSGSGDGFLLFISTVSDKVTKVLPVGSYPTDMTIQYDEDRLYLANWLGPSSQVVDLVTQTLLPPLPLGPDVYRINAGRTGRLYVEGRDQWTDIFVVNSVTGARLGAAFVREGDGEVDPTGRYYYHCDNNISNAHITKYNVTTDVPASVATSAEHMFGSRNLILSHDGSRLFWQGYVYDANLAELRGLGEQIFATTLHGELAFGSSNVYNAQSGDLIYSLPFSTTVQAVSGDQKKLFVYDVGSGGIQMLKMDSLIAGACCVGTTGNTDGSADGLVDLSDAMALVGYLTQGIPLSSCDRENDVNRDGRVNIVDLVVLVNHLVFQGPLPSCR